MTPRRPEAKARKEIDDALAASGWVVQDYDEMNLQAGRGVAVREFVMAPGHGFADYLLFVDGRPVGALEAKPVGHTLTGVEGQARKYGTGVPDELDCPVRPLPFLYLSTGVETRFTNCLDPEPRSRRIFAVHRPETLAEWLRADTLRAWTESLGLLPVLPLADAAPGWGNPSSLLGRLRTLPGGELPGLWANQQQAIRSLEASLAAGRPRALIQMATGSGKSKTAVAQIYRLIKFGGARRVLFLVDRSNLASRPRTSSPTTGPTTTTANSPSCTRCSA